MKIATPIYDVSFKYLSEDSSCAKIKTTEDAYLVVIIEVQKQSKEVNLISLRQYLGNQYSNRQNFSKS